MNQKVNRKAVVLLSGGLDSATTLAIAINQGYQCYALSFNYGQRSITELNAASTIAKQLGALEHRIIRLNLEDFGGSAITDHQIEIPEQSLDEIPITYVPARNTVFMSLALAWAEVLESHAIFIGVNSIDYSGYPDCRPEYIAAFEKMANLATRSGVTGKPIKIETPLIDLSKEDIIKTGTNLGVNYRFTVSCYQANTEGHACGHCDSCRLRAEGFNKAGLQDPTIYQ